MSRPTTTTIGAYLLKRLHELGIGHIFGVPGDFVLGFMADIEASSIELINTCDEQGAGFAADAYARLKGLGAFVSRMASAGSSWRTRPDRHTRSGCQW